MAVDYSAYTDIFDLKNAEAILREYPETDAAALATLKRGQKLRRLDTFYWNGAWVRFYADVQGGAKYEGYLHADDVAESALDEAPAQQQQQQPQPQQPAPTPPAAPPAVTPPPTTSPPQQQAGGAPAVMMALGSVDADVTEQAWAAFLSVIEHTTGVSWAQIPETTRKIKDGQVVATGPSIEKVAQHRLPAAAGAVTVAQVQQGLKAAGFFPGGKVDGIYGYRTRSAVRLFQEYMGAMKGADRKVHTPDGRIKPETVTLLRNYLTASEQPDWQPKPEEHAQWISLLQQVKQKYAAAPDLILQKVNAYPHASDTCKVADWDFSGGIQLIGVRHGNDVKATHSDDIFVLLIKGLVFKFQGSTEPGHTKNDDGLPFLTHGQHDYRFGWHKQYLALRPKSTGVLVVRALDKKRITEADLQRDLYRVNDINIHWGGRGMNGVLNVWSEGCQVISGSVYMPPNHQIVECKDFIAVDPFEALTRADKTRGAFNLLSDLVIAYASDLPDDTVRYTMLTEDDLDLAPDLKADLADARTRVMGLIGH